jgi:hypothetical protein
VAGKVWHSKILANFPVTNVPRWTDIKVKILGLKHLQCPDMGSRGEYPDETDIVHHQTDELNPLAPEYSFKF